MLIVSYSTGKRDLYGTVGVNEYSYVTATEAEELRIQREAAEKLRHEAEDLLAKTYFGITFNPPRSVEITKVIFNNPATIVFWSDGKKTVVKCAGDEAFDEEKGLAMAISKRVLGNQGNYYNEFKKWLPTIEVPCGRKNCNECDDFDCKNTPDDKDKGVSMDEACRQACEAVESFSKAMIVDKRYACNSCTYLETSLNDEPCKYCFYYNSKYESRKGDEK